MANKVGRTVVYPVKTKLEGKSQQEQFNEIAKLLRQINVAKSEQNSMNELIALLESGNLQVAVSNQVSEHSGEGLVFEFDGEASAVLPSNLMISDQQAQEISALLTIGEGEDASVLIKPEDVKDVNAFLGAIRDYVNATNTAISLLSSDDESNQNEQKIKELNETIDRITGERDAASKEIGALKEEKSAIEQDFKRYKRSSRIITSIVAGVLGLSLIASGMFHYSGKQAKDKVKAYEDTLSGYSEQLDEANKELDEIANIVGDGDLSDKVSDIVNDLAVAEGKLSEIEVVLTENNQSVVDGNVSQALVDLIAGLNSGSSVTPDDGINQAHVDAVYQSIASALAQLGVTEESLKDAEGYYSTEALTEAVGSIVEEAVENKAVIENISSKVEASLSEIEKEEGGSYKLSDFATVEDALDKIQEHITTLAGENKTLTAQVDSISAELNDLKEDYADAVAEIEELSARVTELVNENEKLGTEIDKITEEKEALEKENADLEEALKQSNNSSQDNTTNEQEGSTNSPVGDKEVDNESSPSQTDKNTGKGPEENTEPGV